MSGVRSTVFVQSTVGITMVSNDNCFIILCFGSFDYILHASVYSDNSFLYSFVNAGMTYHVTISEVHYNEIVFVFVDGSYQFIFHFVSAHFRFQVISSHFRRWNEDTVFLVKRSFTSTVEEECHMGILLRFSDMKLALAIGSKIFA